MASIIETRAVSFRKGDTQANLNFLGVQGEIVVDLGYKYNGIQYGTDSNATIRLHNSINRGGIPMARADFLNVSTEALAEHRGFLGDKNLAYADLSNLEELESTSAIASNIVKVFNTYGLAKTSYVDSEVNRRALVNMSNVNTVNLATSTGHGGKNLAYADMSNVSTVNLATSTGHAGKNLAYADTSNLDVAQLSSDSKGDAALALKNMSNVDGNAIYGRIVNAGYRLEETTNKITTIPGTDTTIDANKYPTANAVRNYVETRIEDEVDGRLYNNLINLNGVVPSSADYAELYNGGEYLPWRIRNSEVITSPFATDILPTQKYQLATVRQVWEILNDVANNVETDINTKQKTYDVNNTFLHKTNAETVVGVKTFSRPIMSDADKTYKVVLTGTGIGNAGSMYAIGDTVLVANTGGEVTCMVQGINEETGAVTALVVTSNIVSANYAPSGVTAGTSNITTGATGSGLTVRYSTTDITPSAMLMKAKTTISDPSDLNSRISYTPISSVESNIATNNNELVLYVYADDTTSFYTEDEEGVAQAIPAGTRSGLHLVYNNNNPYAVFDKCDLATNDNSYKVATTKYVQANLAGAVSTIKTSNLTVNRAVISNSSGKIAVSNTTSTELGYVHGVTSSIQTQIGTLSSLTTDSKTSLQSAINEVDSHTDTNTSHIGTLTSLTTDAKGNLVAAINEVDSHTDTNTSNITTINSKIPTQASASNQLADKAFVNSTVQTNTANFRGNWTDWSSVPTVASSYPEDYAGNKTPTVNDYLVVQDASGYTGDTLDGTWRFKYTGVWGTDGKAGWIPEYQVNETPMTAAQLAALNSGITSTLVSQINTNTSNITSLTNNKQNNITGAATTITTNNLTTNRALISNGSGKVAVSAVTSTQLGYLSNVTSDIQGQLDDITGGGSGGGANLVHTTGDETINGIKTFVDGIEVGTADLAELYEADEDYEEGTLVCFGGSKEITKATAEVNAVISSKPAIILNSEAHGLPIALAGKVNVKVKGSVRKFDKIKLSDIAGVGTVKNAFNDNVIAIALEENLNEGIKLVKCVTKFSF